MENKFYRLRSNQYYISRPNDENIDFEKSYWGEIVDPDGKIRNRLDEREASIKNLTNELLYINSRPPAKILDVGCGLGFLLSAVNDSWDKYGLEISSFAAGYAKKWTNKIFIGQLENMDFDDNYFDLIVLYHVIEHIYKPENILLEIIRILKNTGVLILGTPDFDSGCARLFDDNYRLLHDKSHISLFSNDSMHRFLRDYGLQINFVDYPYFDTEYFSIDNFKRLSNRNKISPPFYGNFMTFYCTKRINKKDD